MSKNSVKRILRFHWEFLSTSYLVSQENVLIRKPNTTREFSREVSLMLAYVNVWVGFAEIV